jgi:two-component system chemotaxis response regulator CheY
MQSSDSDIRARLAGVRVLIADRDHRTANLVLRILFSFGMRHIDLTTNGEDALELLRTKPFDFIITEWNMHPFDGIALVKAIRGARDDKRIRRDIPIIMLTAQSELENVQEARDAGISEFVAKPFSAATISSRIVQIIDNPRSFVESPSYAGPCRRRRGAPPPGMKDRRGSGSAKTVLPPNYSLRTQLSGTSAKEILNESIIETAQKELLESRGEYIGWAHTEVVNLKTAFAALNAAPQSTDAQRALISAAYAIQSQAGIFGYELGTEVAKLLVNYVSNHLPPRENHLRVIGKYIEAASVTFNQNVEQYGQSIARDLIASLSRLVEKFD